jgi:hypothetical protein
VKEGWRRVKKGEEGWRRRGHTWTCIVDSLVIWRAISVKACISSKVDDLYAPRECARASIISFYPFSRLQDQWNCLDGRRMREIEDRDEKRTYNALGNDNPVLYNVRNVPEVMYPFQAEPRMGVEPDISYHPACSWDDRT